MTSLENKFINFLEQNNCLILFYDKLFESNYNLLKIDNNNIRQAFKHIMYNSSCNDKDFYFWCNMTRKWVYYSLYDNDDLKLFFRFLKENNNYNCFLKKLYHIDNLLYIDFYTSYSSILSHIRLENDEEIKFWRNVQIKWNVLFSKKIISNDTVEQLKKYINYHDFQDCFLYAYDFLKWQYKIYNYDLSYDNFLYLMIQFPLCGNFKNYKYSIKEIIDNFKNERKYD